MALVLDGSGDYVTFGDVLDFGTFSDVTFCAWIKLGTLNLNGTIISKGFFDSVSLRHTWDFEDDTRVLQGASWTSFSGGQTAFWANPSLSINTWYWVVFQASVSSNFCRLYVDGTLRGSVNATPPTGFATSKPLAIGANYDTSWGSYWNGKLAHVHYYKNNLLTTGEMATLSTSPGSITDGLQGYWPLIEDANDGYGSTNGTAVGGASFDSDDPAPTAGETYDEAGNGGVVAAGLGSTFVMRTVEGIGGVSIGGAAGVSSLRWLASSCSLCNSFNEDGSGGVGLGGTAVESYFGTSGGSVLGGSAVVDMPLSLYDGLEGLWALGEDGGPFVDSANGNDGTTSFPPSQDNGLLCAYSQAFTERTFISLPADSIGPTASFSVSLHAKINGYYQQRTWFTRGSGDYWKFRLGHTVANHAWASIQLLDSDEELVVVDVFSTTLLAREKWYHVAATWNGKLSLFINGTLEAESEAYDYRLPDNATDGHIGRWKGFGCESNLQELRLYPEAYDSNFWTAERDNFCKASFFLVAPTEDLLA